jgi:P-type Cu+ transporter
MNHPAYPNPSSVQLRRKPANDLNRVRPKAQAARLHTLPLKDPVCGMPVTVNSWHRYEHEGHTHYLCSSSCKIKLSENPRQFLAGKPAPEQAQAPAGAIYTCSVHPQLRQDHAGNCPVCCLALQLLLPESNENGNSELHDFQRRIWWSLPLTVMVFVLSLFGNRLQWMDETVLSWLELGLAAPVVLWAGWPIFTRSWQSVCNRSPNRWTLIGLGTGAAFFYSVLATMAPQVFPASFVALGRAAVYFEAAAVIISLVLLAQVLELKARVQTTTRRPGRG